MKEPVARLAYLAGWFASDGHLETNARSGRHIGFLLAQKDADVLERFREWFGGTLRSYDYPREGKPYLIVKWVSWRKDLYNFLLDGDFKHHLIEGSTEVQRVFIRGFLEGDGHVGFRSNGT